jgi:hypothetical protein
MSPLLRNRQLQSIAAGLVILAAQLFVFPIKAAAIPLSEYQQHLQNAIVAFHELYEMDEEDTEYSAKVKQTVDGIRAGLPEQLQVETGAEVYTVSNESLHDDLDNLEKSPDQAEAIRQLLEKLNALQDRVTERASASASGENKGWAKSRLESILARPEYVTGARDSNALTRLILDIVRRIQSLLPQRQPMDLDRGITISRVVQIAIVAASGLLLAYVAAFLVKRFRRTKKHKAGSKNREARIVLGERLEPEETATNLLSEAEALARRGELRAAIRKGYIALLVELGDRRIISLAQHKTNRDYLRGLRDAPQLHSQMRGLTDSFERHWYGFAEANENDWQQFRAGYLAALQTGK